MGSIEEGISAAKWSPDEEVLAIATAVDTFVLLTRTFDPIAEANITAADLSLSKHVSVGWGKKETQFQGKGARAQRDPTMPVHVDSGVLHATDDRKVEISWRGDGEVVSVIVIDKEPVERRTVRVYTREGTLDSVSEPVDNLIGLVSWKPSGSLIACVQKKPEGPELVFFERNGLRRGEFSLRIGPEEQVLALDWNMESDTLAVQLEDKIQLWTTKNYHWYLKKEIISPSGAKPTYMKWHAEKAHTLVINYGSSEVHICEFIWDVTRGATAGPVDIGLTMVIDGQNINLTPLSMANTPPPMSFRSFQTSTTPIDVSVSRSNKIFAAITNTGLELAEWDPSLASTGIRNVKNPQIVSTSSYDTFLPSDELPKQVVFIGSKTLAIAVDTAEGGSQIALVQLVESDGKNKYDLDIVALHDISSPVFLMKSTPAVDFAFFETVDGTVYSFQSELQSIAPITTMPRRCDAVEVYFPIGEEIGMPIVFGLHATGKVYCNDRQIANSGTSLCMTDKYLIFTTAQNLLKFCHLSSDPEKIEVPDDASVGDERCRSIERGSLVVTAMPSRTAFTLQAPRGNLETIYPRVMVLTGVRNAIMNLKYNKAFAECRVHRIDLNILYDYNPKQFFEQLELFVKQLGSVEYLDLFLSGLREEDVTKTMYRSTIEDAGIVEDNAVASVNKVNDICAKVVDLLVTEPYKEKFHQSVLTSYACMTPPALEDALALVGRDRESDKKLTEFSIQHLCFLQDVNLLYDTALGIYDLPLTLLVAQQSQKDPKEYLPFLRALHKQSLIRRKFEIDSYLKKYTKALQHISELGDEAFDELLDFVVDHELYKEALSIYKYSTEKQDAILKLYASYLQGKMEYSQSGLIYEHLGDYPNALDLYELSGEWQQALSIAAKSYEGDDDIAEKTEDLATRLAEATLETRQYKDSATIYLDHLNNVREAVRVLCKGFFFKEAIRIVSQQPSSDQNGLTEEIVTPGVLEGFAQITELVSDCKGQINSQISRLQVLRLKKEEDPLAFFGQDESDAPDNVSIAASETSTAPSFITRYTGKTEGTAKTGASRRTVKNRRREERKRARGKKGSIYEEEYLINSMGRLVDRLQEQQPDAVRLIDALLRHANDSNMRTRAYQVQRAYTEVLDLLKENVDYVFAMTERDRERFDDEGNMYLIPSIPVPEIKPFPKFAMLDF